MGPAGRHPEAPPARPGAPDGTLAVVERHAGVAKNADFGALGWPPRYAARRLAWHVLDHLWDIEDKSEPA